MEEIPKQYCPKETEDKWYAFWEKNRYFSAATNPQKKPYSIVIPPPNVTGILHMGHALNNTIQDILIRYQRMKGRQALWMPGTDHAGIATQNVVEKAIAKEGLRRQDLGREKFIQRVWAWKEEYGSTIIRQLKKLGASCDWERLRFTMDEQYSEAVIEAFLHLYKKGLVYQGNYIINWCPRCQTALADEEAPHRQLQGNLYYIRYPLKQATSSSAYQVTGTHIIVATTRPETMLGDAAVAVNPRDKRYKGLIGKGIILPLVDREITIIADDGVDMKFGTGALKVTPAHDPNDYVIGKKHELEFINVMTPDGKMNANAGNFQGMDRFEAREAILEDLKEKGLLERIQAHELSAGHCYRCHTIVEPYLSKQWFVKMRPLALAAIEAVKKGKIRFYPRRWTKVYLNWMQNIQDWCISRQIWWGHRIPVYYCKNCQAEPVAENKKSNQNKGIIVSREKPQKCPHCGSGQIHQDEDVLDTWFSSWLWPFATFFWPFSAGEPELRKRRQEELKYFYPTSCLVTAPEIIFFWVARMIMAGYEFMKEPPFQDIYIHGTVRDIEGKKMSKSLGNIIDPLEVINEYGADALRFSLISITAQGQDVYLSKDRFEQGRNFANKIWNASRFILTNLKDADIAKTDLCLNLKQAEAGIINRWILSRFYSTLKEADKYLASYKFNEAANLLYSFFWHEFCDWYLELIKPMIDQPQNQLVMYKVLEKFLRAIHPFMPFISEEVWQKLAPDNPSIMLSSWPHIQEGLIDKKIEAELELLFLLVTQVRNMRQDIEIPLQQKINLRLSAAIAKQRKLLEELGPQISYLCRASSLEISNSFIHQKSTARAVVKGIHIGIPLEGIVDIASECLKISKKIAQAEHEIKSKENLLGNSAFSKNAPPEVVKKEKTRLTELKETVKKLKSIENELKG